MQTPNYNDVIENGWASHDNPTRFGYFSERRVYNRKVNGGTYLRMTDGKGNFWEIPATNERFDTKATNHGQVSISTAVAKSETKPKEGE